ncbi:hypothetical protein F8388_018373 [Cannabis sativa]|uniref:Uncharacterized protein n=1 Tax=Cannabis sativa TaxID=3483 RepID=A0A7J6HF09_CANSA|nr:hypothetical protein F8388_018373 [Cannabis sativa]
MNSIFRFISQRPCPARRLVVFHSSFSTKPRTKVKPKPTYSNSSSTTAASAADSAPSFSPNLSHSPSSATLSPSGDIKKEKSSPPAPDRPTEIPFQAKVSNLVHLIGYVHAPVQFETSSNGSFWAATVITQNPTSSSSENESSDDLPLWVPTVFEGDLAHIAASHLKVNDRVYIAGKLSASLPHLSYNQFQASVQVMVHALNFVEETVQMKKSSTLCVPEQGTSFIKEIEKGTLNNSDPVKTNMDSLFGPWSDLIDNPKEWLDCRDKKVNGLVSRKYPDFKRKDDKKALWLDSAPKQVLKKISALEFDISSQNSNEVKQFKDGVKKDGDSAINSWNNLIDNPKQWWDYRNCKHNGLVNPKYPDFKHKDGSQSLWLSSAPLWLSSKIKGLEFDVPTPKSKEVNGNKGEIVHFSDSICDEGLREGEEKNKRNRGDDMWKELLENPNKWWDNRIDKKNERAPDFKHKETGEGLWLSSSPIWVQSKLQPPKTKGTQDVGHVSKSTRGAVANAYMEN